MFLLYLKIIPFCPRLAIKMTLLTTQYENPLIISYVNCLLVLSIAVFMYIFMLYTLTNDNIIFIYYAEVDFTDTRVYISIYIHNIPMYVDTCLPANPPHCSNRICAKRVYLNMYRSTSYERGRKVSEQLSAVSSHNWLRQTR